MTMTDMVREALAHFANDKGLKASHKQIAEYIHEKFGKTFNRGVLGVTIALERNPNRKQIKTEKNKKYRQGNRSATLRIEAKLDRILELLESRDERQDVHGDAPTDPEQGLA